jgi:thioredoxin 1
MEKGVETENMETNVRKSKIKIIVPIIIILVVAGIWFAKSALKAPSTHDGVAGNGIQNEDFALNVEGELDLEKLKSYGIPIILDFGSETCPPCREMAPVLKKVHEDLLGKAIIKYVDIDGQSKLASEYPVRVIPTQFFFNKDGEPFMPEESETARMIIYTDKETGEHALTSHEGGLSEEQLISILLEMGMEND